MGPPFPYPLRHPASLAMGDGTFALVSTNRWGTRTRVHLYDGAAWSWALVGEARAPPGEEGTIVGPAAAVRKSRIGC